MSVERPKKYIQSFLALAFAFSLRSSEALPENNPITSSEPPITSESSPVVDLSRPEIRVVHQKLPTPTKTKVIFPTPTEKPTFTPTPTEKPTPTPTAAPIPTEMPTPTLSPIPSKEEVVIAEISLSLWEEKTYQAIQELRKEKNLPTLELSPALVEIARQRSLDMTTRNYFGHDLEDRIIVFDLLDQTGIYYPYAGENLYRTDANDSQIEWTVQTAMDRFLESPTHKRNLLRPEFSLIGIGYALSEEDNFKYLTIIFTSFPESSQ